MHFYLHSLQVELYARLAELMETVAGRFGLEIDPSANLTQERVLFNPFKEVN